MELRPPAREVRWVALLTAAYVVVSLWFTRHGTRLPPDTLEYAGVARSLVEGHGYTIDLVEIHAGLLPRVRHLHELHGLLEPFLLVPLFALFGPSIELAVIPGILLVAGVSIAAFLLAREEFGRWAGIFAWALVLSERFLTQTGTLGADDVGQAFFSTLALVFFFRALRSPQPKLTLPLLGMCCALGVLQKVSGAIVPAVLLATMAVMPRVRRTLGFRGAIWIAAPAIAGMLVYAARNVALHGSPGFRYSALDWYWKDNFVGYFAYYDPAPRVLGVLRQLGRERVWQITKIQFGYLWTVMKDAPLVFAGGPIALVVLRKSHPVMATLAALYSAGALALVCFVYHVEARYLLGLHPLFLIAIAGAATSFAEPLIERTTLRWPGVRVAAFALAALAVAGGLASVLLTQRDFGRNLPTPGACDDALDFIRESVGEREAVLTTDPWYVTWATRRPTVNVPTNGEVALSKVATHYGARWLLDGPYAFGGADTGAMVTALDAGSALHPEPAFVGRVCKVYELRPR